MSNDRKPLKTHENHVDFLQQPLNEGEHYYVRSGVDRTVKHYIGSKAGTPILVSPTDGAEVVDEVLDRSVKGETLTGAINGSNATYTTAFDFIPETVEVFYNGVLQSLLDDYITTGTNTVVFTFSPEVPDKLKVNYIKQI